MQPIQNRPLYSGLSNYNREVVKWLRISGIMLIVLCVLLIVFGVVLITSSRTTAADFAEENTASITLSTYTLNPSEIASQSLTEAYDDVVVEPEWITYWATAYCPNECCCGAWSRIAFKATASGVGAVEGRTIAMDPSYPFGTRIYIEGLGERVCEDRGGAIVGDRIDLYFETHEAACEWGMRQVRAYVIKED